MPEVEKISATQVYSILNEVLDPEVPALTIVDLGIVRNVELINTTWKITITPTYTGCPAMKVIEEDIFGEILENILSAEESITNALPKGKENIKGYVLKTTMGKPLKLGV